MNNVHFPSDVHIVGTGSVSKTGDGTEKQKFYVEGVHKELHYLGALGFQEAPSGELETVVTVTTGLPSEDFLG